MKNAIVEAAKKQMVNPESIAMEERIKRAQYYIKSGLLPSHVRDASQYIVIEQMAYELGIGKPLSAAAMIYVINGKATVAPRLMLALVNRSGQLEDIKIEKLVRGTDSSVTVTVKRKGRSPHSSTFGVREAMALQLMGKDNYKKQPMTMFTWRALSANLAITFPDIIMGLYTPEELGADVIISEDSDFDIKDVKITETETRSEAQAPKESVEEMEKLIDLASFKAGELAGMMMRLHNSNLESAAAEFRDLSSYTIKNKGGELEDHFIEFDDLPYLVKTKPHWIIKLHEKLAPGLEKRIEVANAEKAAAQ